MIMSSEERYIQDKLLKFIEVKKLKGVQINVLETDWIDIFINTKKDEWVSLTAHSEDSAIAFLYGVWLGREYYE